MIEHINIDTIISDCAYTNARMEILILNKYSMFFCMKFDVLSNYFLT